MNISNMNKSKKRLGAALSTLFIATVLSGCMTPPAKGPSTSDIDSAIDEATRGTTNERLKSAGGDAVTSARAAQMKGGTVSMRYQGDAATLLSQVADARGARFRVSGPEPRLPLFVAVSVVNMPYRDFLRDVGDQFGQRADVVPCAGGTYETCLEIRYRQH